MSTDRRHITVTEYAMLRNLESLTNSLLRVNITSVRQMQKSWLWQAMQQQVQSLVRFRTDNLQGKGREEDW